MQSFLEFCAGSRVAKAFAKTMYVPERPKSPIEEDSVGEKKRKNRKKRKKKDTLRRRHIDTSSPRRRSD